MFKSVQTFKTDRIRQTIPYIYYSARKEMQSDFTTSRFVQLVCMPYKQKGTRKNQQGQYN